MYTQRSLIHLWVHDITTLHIKRKFCFLSILWTVTLLMIFKKNIRVRMCEISTRNANLKWLYDAGLRYVICEWLQNNSNGCVRQLPYRMICFVPWFWAFGLRHNWAYSDPDRNLKLFPPRVDEPCTLSCSKQVGLTVHLS